jgi:hypothetical protein
MAAWSDKLIWERACAAERLALPILPYIRACLELTMPWRLEGNAGRPRLRALFDSTGPVNVQRSASGCSATSRRRSSAGSSSRPGRWCRRTRSSRSTAS